MDRRINYKIVIDTETCPVDKTIVEVSPFNMWAYDIGWAVVDKRGNVYKTQSYLVKEIFIGEKELMCSSYYINKISAYWEDVNQGKRKIASFYEIKKALYADITEYEVDKIFAHNMFFDYNNLNNTSRWLTKSAFRYYFPYGIEICDTLKMARDVLSTMPTYEKFCAENGFLTSNNKPRYTAEIIYRYITQDIDFKESHTGLEDVLIEKDIMAYLYRQHKKMRRLLYEPKAED